LGEYRRVVLLVLIMSGVALLTSGVAIAIVYETAFEQVRLRLIDVSRAKAGLIGAKAVSGGGDRPTAVTAAPDLLGLLGAADPPVPVPAGHAAAGIALSLGLREGDEIAIASVRGGSEEAILLRMPVTAPGTEAMRRALGGEAGTLADPDPEGVPVLAAYLPVAGRPVGVVVAMDLAAIRAPFLRAGAWAIVLALILIALGTTWFFAVSEPMVTRLTRNERRFRELFDNLRSGVLVVEARDGGADFIVADANPATLRIEGVTRDGLIGQPLAAIEGEGEGEAQDLRQALRRVWQTGLPEHLPPSLRHSGSRPGWREYDICRLPDGELVVLIDDVSQRKATEDQLRQAQRMETIGQFTGGIAHDFNNLLGVVIGNLQLLAERLGDDPYDRELLSDTLISAGRGSDLVDQLLAFARRRPLHPVPTDVNAVVRATGHLLRRTLGPASVLEESLEPALWPSSVDRVRLENTLVNLIVNARDAMPDGGEVTIRTANRTLGPADLDGWPDVASGDFVLIEVADQGIGIPETIRDRVFEPFFTTKGPGQGSGLGLSMVYGFVKQSGGVVQVESQVGVGTAVRIFLPRATAAPGSLPGADSGPALPASAAECPVSARVASGR
jgi:signal transduction histidine kinase